MTKNEETNPESFWFFIFRLVCLTADKPADRNSR